MLGHCNPYKRVCAIYIHLSVIYYYGIGDVHTHTHTRIARRDFMRETLLVLFHFFTLYCAPMTKDIPQSNSSKGTKWRLMHLYNIYIYIICVCMYDGTTYIIIQCIIFNRQPQWNRKTYTYLLCRGFPPGNWFWGEKIIIKSRSFILINILDAFHK